MRWITPCVMAVGLACWLWAGAGCQGATSSGRQYSVNFDRRLESYLVYDQQVVFQAAVDVVRDQFKYRIERQVCDKYEGIIDARTARDGIVRVETYLDADHMTRIEIYVGPSGDESVAREILTAIEQRLASK